MAYQGTNRKVVGVGEAQQRPRQVFAFHVAMALVHHAGSKLLKAIGNCFESDESAVEFAMDSHQMVASKPLTHEADQQRVGNGIA